MNLKEVQHYNVILVETNLVLIGDSIDFWTLDYYLIQVKMVVAYAISWLTRTAWRTIQRASVHFLIGITTLIP